MTDAESSISVPRYPARQRDGELEPLLLRVAAGEDAAFETLYARVSPMLLGVCRRILGEQAETEDALQDCFVTIWRQAGRFDPARGSAFAWLVTLARNRAVDRLRSPRRMVSIASSPLTFDLVDPTPLPDAVSEATDDAARLLACMDRLGSASELIRAAFFEGSTYAELAARVTMPLGTLKSRIRRALLKLRECLA